MELSTIPKPSTVQLAKIITGRYAAGRLLMPVARQQSVYARFKNIQGIPAADTNGSYSLNKLRLLDFLLDSLKKVKGAAAPLGNLLPSATETGLKQSGPSSSSLDGLINKISAEIHTALSASPFTAGLADLQPGMLLSLSA